MTAISPEQYQAMREWLRSRARWTNVAALDHDALRVGIEFFHPGGLTAFLAEHPPSDEGRGGDA